MGELRSIKLKCPVLKKSRAKEFTRWWPLFKAYAQQIGFADMLTETKSKELPKKQEKEQDEVQDDKGTVVVEDITHTDEEKKAVNRNATAIASFYTAFQDLEDMDCLSYVLGSVDDKWPTGKSWVVVKELHEEFSPNDLRSEIHLKKELAKLTLKEHEDPKKLFSRIVAIEAKYRDRGCVLTEKEKLQVVCTESPEPYDDIIEAALKKDRNKPVTCLTKFRFSTEAPVSNNLSQERPPHHS